MTLPTETPTDTIVPAVSMNISIPNDKPDLIQAEQIVGLCKTIMADIDAEKTEITDTLNNFAEMVFNAGDATSATKEALVNMYNLRASMIDKKTKMMEMMLKVHMREGPKVVQNHQHNDIHVTDKRKFLEELNKKKT